MVLEARPLLLSSKQEPSVMNLWELIARRGLRTIFRDSFPKVYGGKRRFERHPPFQEVGSYFGTSGGGSLLY
ncbi:MAG: hypothetical protein ACK4OO_04295 [bacterium]